jgi:outer membrane receptor for ferrienterochelin and colicins
MPILPQRYLLLLIPVALGVHSAAHAQSIDYGALERLFQEPVTTSVTGSPQRVTDVPASMTIITAEDIRRSGAYDLPGVLRHVPGVDFQQWTDDQPEISMRGYDQPYSQRVLVLINGRQVYADDYSFTPWSSLPVELGAIRQIELVKGPGSALFGFNAVGGVINIVTYNPLYDDTDSASVSAGSQQLAQGSAIGTLPLGQAGGVRVSGGARSNKDFPNAVAAASSDLAGRINHRRDANLDGAVRLNDSTSLRVEASSTHVEQNQVNPVYQYDYEVFDTDSVKAQLNSDSPYGLLQLTAYDNRMNQTSVAGILGVPVVFSDRITVIQAEDVFKLGAHHTFRVALEYRYESTNTSPITGAEVFYNVKSASGMWNWQLSPRLTLTNALRLDDLTLGRSGYSPPGYPFNNSDWNRELNVPSFNSGLVLRLDDSDTLRLMAARGTLLPNLIELGSLLYTTPLFGGSGTPTLEPTVVDNYEGDWDRDLPQYRAHLRATVFYQNTDGMIALTGNVVLGPGGAAFLTPSVIGDSHALGATLALDGRLLEHWRWGMDLRLERVRQSFSTAAAAGVGQVTPHDETPAQLAKFNVGWSQGPWEDDVYVLYQSHTNGLAYSGVVAGTVISVPAFAAVDARIAYRLNAHLGLALSGQNLLHSQQTQTSGEPVQRRWLATFTAAF